MLWFVRSVAVGGELLVNALPRATRPRNTARMQSARCVFDEVLLSVGYSIAASLNLLIPDPQPLFVDGDPTVKSWERIRRIIQVTTVMAALIERPSALLCSGCIGWMARMGSKVGRGPYARDSYSCYRASRQSSSPATSQVKSRRWRQYTTIVEKLHKKSRDSPSSQHNYPRHVIFLVSFPYG